MKIILLGGVPGVGKSTISNYLAIKYNIYTIINIDIIKQTLKIFKNKDKERYLYTTTHNASKIEDLAPIEAYLKHSRVINKYIESLINNIEDKTIIIEGATVNKEMYNELSKKYEVIYLNIYAEKEELLQRYHEKGKIRKSNWIENINVIEIIKKYLLSNNQINILSTNLTNTLKEVYLYVEEFLHN